MKRGPAPFELFLQYCGVLFLLTLLGLAVLAVTHRAPVSDEHCASSPSSTC